jgi:hypothetical protein
MIVTIENGWPPDFGAGRHALLAVDPEQLFGDRFGHGVLLD